MTYFILFGILLLATVAFYFIFKKDLLSPTVISGAMFAFCVMLAGIGLISWNNVSTLSPKLMLIVSLGLISFGLGELLVRRFCPAREKTRLKLKIIKVKNWKYIIAILVIILTGVLLVTEISRICDNYSCEATSLPQKLSFYRTKIGLFSADLAIDGTDINFFVKQLRKVCDILCVIFMLIFVNNFFAKDKAKNLVWLAVPIVGALSLTLLTSGRSLLMHMIVALAMAILIFYRGMREQKKTTRRIMSFGGIFVVIALTLFYFALPLVGRDTSHNFIDYTTFYLGTSMPSFEQHLGNTTMAQSDSNFGSETFASTYYSIDRMGIIEYKKASTLEWTQLKSGFNSNVYTSFRRYYNDFGLAGVVVCQFIAGCLISLFYLGSLRQLSKRKYLFLMFYLFFSYILIDQIRDEQFFGLVSSATVAYILIGIVIYYFYFTDELKSISLKCKLLKGKDHAKQD